MWISRQTIYTGIAELDNMGDDVPKYFARLAVEMPDPDDGAFRGAPRMTYVCPICEPLLAREAIT